MSDIEFRFDLLKQKHLNPGKDNWYCGDKIYSKFYGVNCSEVFEEVREIDSKNIVRIAVCFFNYLSNPFKSLAITLDS